MTYFLSDRIEIPIIKLTVRTGPNASEICLSGRENYQNMKLSVSLSKYTCSITTFGCISMTSKKI